LTPKADEQMNKHHDIKEQLQVWLAHTHSGLERLMVVALADSSLAAQLLVDPWAALDRAQPILQLSPAERAMVASITGAADIHDFAARLYSRVQQEQDSGR
jgi:hypothetical protein